MLASLLVTDEVSRPHRYPVGHSMTTSFRRASCQVITSSAHSAHHLHSLERGYIRRNLSRTPRTRTASGAVSIQADDSSESSSPPGTMRGHQTASPRPTKTWPKTSPRRSSQPACYRGFLPYFPVPIFPLHNAKGFERVQTYSLNLSDTPQVHYATRITSLKKGRRPLKGDVHNSWSQLGELNSRPTDYESVALPSELSWHSRRRRYAQRQEQSSAKCRHVV